MWDWLATFWTGNQDVLITTVVGTVIGGLVLYLITTLTNHLFRPDTKQQRRRHMSRLDGFKAKLEQHRMERRNLGAVALRELIFVILQTMLAVLGIVLFQTISMGESLILLRQESVPQLEEIRAAFYPLFGILAVFIVWFMANLFGSLRRIVILLNFADWKENRLIKRIKRLEPDWKDGKP